MSSITTLRQNYYNKIFGQEDETLIQIRKEAQNSKIENMQLSPADAHILQFLTQSCQIKNAVEIGGLFGYSTLHIARGLVDGGHLFTIDIDQARQEKSRQLIKNDKAFSKISWIHGKALDVLDSCVEKGPFDMVFIDADKSSYFDYLLWSEKNLKIGGIVVIDNAFLFHTLYASPEEIDPLKKSYNVSNAGIKALNQLNQRITSSSHWKGAMIPTIDGLAVAYKIKDPN